MQSIAVLKNTIQRAGQEKFITFAKTSSGTMNNSFEIATPIGSLSITLEGDYVTGIARSGTGRHCEPTGVFACAVARKVAVCNNELVTVTHFSKRFEQVRGDYR